MKRIVIASFFVSRPLDYPCAEYPVIAPYVECLKILDASCKRFGFEHVVLSDAPTVPQLAAAGLLHFAADLPRSLMKATTESQAKWLASPDSEGVHTIFVGADCLIRRDFRAEMPEGDLAIAYMKGHRKWRMNNGFVYVPAASREKVAPLWRAISDDTGEAMCDDMIAIERALLPMPPNYGVYERRGLAVNFLPLPKWNRYMTTKDRRYPHALLDPAKDANVLHFMGGWENGKQLYFDWAKRHGFA